MKRLILIGIFQQLMLVSSSELNSELHLKNTTIASAKDASKLNFPNVNRLWLSYAHVTTKALTKEMLSQLHKTTYFRIEKGQVPAIHVVPQFVLLILDTCKTSEIIIDPGVEYEMTHLAIYGNALREIPENINVLRKLNFLWLRDNLIEHVDMEEFDGLEQLKQIDLSGNKIVEINYPQQLGSLSFPKLESIGFGGNLLTFVNFEHWDAALLDEITLHDNKLTVALFLANKFAKLHHVFISGNPWNCQWLRETRRKFNDSNVEIRDDDLTTCSKAAESLEEIKKNVKLLEQSTALKMWQNTRKVQAKERKLHEKVQKLQKDSQKALKMHTDANEKLQSSK